MEPKEQKCWDSKKMNGGNAPPASIPGLNENLEFMGKQLHIQTENIGFPAARIVTQVFCNGRVILSRKTDHPSIPGDSGDIAHIRELMHSQHHQIIQEIKDKGARLRARISH